MSHPDEQQQQAQGSGMPISSSIPAAVVAEREADVILAPPSPLNPVPSLPAALRIDNREQLVTLLRSDPFLTRTEDICAGITLPSSSMRQLLVFGSETLRTLIMRQILSDPHTRTFKGKKKNWDDANSFPIPQMRGLNIVGTRILLSSASSSSSSAAATTIDVAEGSIGAAEVSLQKNKSWEVFGDEEISNLDIITYFLRPCDLQQTTNVLQRIRISEKKSAQALAASIDNSGSTGSKMHHRIVFIPQPTSIIYKVLSNCGILAGSANISIHKLQLDIFPLETDVLSLEYDYSLKEALIDGIPSTLISTAARSILKLQDVVGKIPRMQGFGPLGEEIIKKVLNLTVDEHLSSPQAGQAMQGQQGLVGNTSAKTVSGGEVTALIIIDRKVDMVTPMLTPLTYEGLLDETLGIDCGFINVDVNTINPEDDNVEDSNRRKDIKFIHDLVSLGVNGSDSLYVEVRDQHVEKFGSFLQNQAIALRESHSNFTSQKGKKKDLSEIHQFVKQIPIFTQNLRSLTNHIHLAELIKATTEETQFRERWQMERSIVEGDTCYDMLEDLVACQYSPYKFLQLLCLQSLCGGGIKSARYDSLRRDVVQTYGYEYLFILGNLEKMGLLKRRDTIQWSIDSTSSPFHNLRRSLILVNAEVDTIDPDDISYVSSGYAPLAVRLVQTSVSSQGWGTSNRDEILNQLSSFVGISASASSNNTGGTGGAVGQDQQGLQSQGSSHSVFVDVTQRDPPEDIASALKRPAGPSLGSIAKNMKSDAKSTNKKPTLMVMFVGGVTYLEIAAMRFLSKRSSFPYHIICSTTKVINGSTMLESLS